MISMTRLWRYIHSRIKIFCSCYIPLKFVNNKEIHFNHPVAIVISKFVEIGENAIIYDQVVIGGKSNKCDKNQYPKIGDNVIIYSGAKIIGNVKIGNNVTIGVNTLVLKDVPDNSIVYGNPMIIKEKEDIEK